MVPGARASEEQDSGGHAVLASLVLAEVAGWTLEFLFATEPGPLGALSGSVVAWIHLLPRVASLAIGVRLLGGGVGEGRDSRVPLMSLAGAETAVTAAIIDDNIHYHIRSLTDVIAWLSYVMGQAAIPLAVTIFCIMELRRRDQRPDAVPEAVIAVPRFLIPPAGLALGSAALLAGASKCTLSGVYWVLQPDLARLTVPLATAAVGGLLLTFAGVRLVMRGALQARATRIALLSGCAVNLARVIFSARQKLHGLDDLPVLSVLCAFAPAAALQVGLALASVASAVASRRGRRRIAVADDRVCPGR